MIEFKGRDRFMPVAAGGNVFRVCKSEKARNIEIMDHQVEYDRDVFAAAGRRPATRKFQLLRRDFNKRQSDRRQDETFLMADLQDQRLSLGDRDQRIGLGDAHGERLFDIDMQAGFKRCFGKAEMRRRGRRDDDRIDRFEK